MEEERAKKEALLSDEEIDSLPSLKRYLNREQEAVINFIHDVWSKEDTQRASGCLSSALSAAKEVAQAQVDKTLKTKGIRIEKANLSSSNSELYRLIELVIIQNAPSGNPVNPLYWKGVTEKLLEILKEYGFVQVLPKKE